MTNTTLNGRLDRPISSHSVGRRQLLGWLVASAGALALPVPAAWAALETRSLAFHSTHTGEALSCTYWDRNGYRGEALADIDHLLRDHRTGDVALIDVGLLDLVHMVRTAMGSTEPFEVISGYRSPKTNEMLRQRGVGVNENSLHMSGRAIDVRLPGRPLPDLRAAAVSFSAGGVGYYPKSNFIHIDVGRVQQW